MDVQFNVVQRQDVTVTFVLPASGRCAARDAPAARRARTPSRCAPSRRGCEPAQRSRIVSISGLVPAPELNRVVDVVSGPVRLPPDGLVLSLKLAEVLGARRGDLVSDRSARRTAARRAGPVAGIVEEYMGTSAYMEIDALRGSCARETRCRARS